jgi:hypothetical protein
MPSPNLTAVLNDYRSYLEAEIERTGSGAEEPSGKLIQDLQAVVSLLGGGGSGGSGGGGTVGGALEATQAQVLSVASTIESLVTGANQARSFLHPIALIVIQALAGNASRRIARIVNTSDVATLYITYDGRQPNPATFDFDDYIEPGSRYSMTGYHGAIYVAANLSEETVNFIATEFTS